MVGEMAHVQKRLGHASIQTCDYDYYVHLAEGDLVQKYLQKRERLDAT